MSTAKKESKMVDIVWTLPEGKQLESFRLEYGGKPKTVGDQDSVTEVAFKKLSAKGLCKKVSASKAVTEA